MNSPALVILISFCSAVRMFEPFLIKFDKVNLKTHENHSLQVSNGVWALPRYYNISIINLYTSPGCYELLQHNKVFTGARTCISLGIYSGKLLTLLCIKTGCFIVPTFITVPSTVHFRQGYPGHLSNSWYYDHPCSRLNIKTKVFIATNRCYLRFLYSVKLTFIMSCRNKIEILDKILRYCCKSNTPYSGIARNVRASTNCTINTSCSLILNYFYARYLFTHICSSVIINNSLALFL